MRSWLEAPLVCAALVGSSLSCGGAAPDNVIAGAPAARPVAAATEVQVAAPPPSAPLPVCGARPPPARGEPRASPGQAASASESEASRKALAQSALARVPVIAKEVAKLRQLPFKKPVPSRYQSTKDFRAFVDRSVGGELTAEKNKATSRALHHLGLFTKELDLASTLTDTMVSQVGGYYDPQQGTFFVVMVAADNMMNDTVVAHELTHAIQDQHFGLQAYLGAGPAEKPAGKRLSSDAASARRFIVEGEATLIMMAYTVYSMSKSNLLDKENETLARTTLQAISTLSVERLREMATSQLESMSGAGDDFAQALEGMEDIPPYLLMPLIGAYFQGIQPVYEAYAARGWPGVAELYTHAPESTEQVLHPVDKLVGDRDLPVELSLPAAPAGFPGAAKLMQDTLGELGWQAYFETWCTNDFKEASAGWDGDTVAVYDTGASLLALIATTWDSDEDATQFLNAYAASLGVRFPGSTVEVAGDRVKVARGNGTFIVVERRGADVLVVDGATDDSQITLAVPIARASR